MLSNPMHRQVLLLSTAQALFQTVSVLVMACHARRFVPYMATVTSGMFFLTAHPTVVAYGIASTPRPFGSYHVRRWLPKGTPPILMLSRSQHDEGTRDPRRCNSSSAAAKRDLNSRGVFWRERVLNATYRNHGTRAEAIEVVFDSEKLCFRELLEFFFQFTTPQP